MVAATAAGVVLGDLAAVLRAAVAVLGHLAGLLLLDGQKGAK